MTGPGNRWSVFLKRYLNKNNLTLFSQNVKLYSLNFDKDVPECNERTFPDKLIFLYSSTLFLFPANSVYQ